MTFDEVLDQIRELLRSRGRLSYVALKRRFAIDDAYLEDLKAELIEAEQVASDENGRILVWTGNATGAATPAPNWDSGTESPSQSAASLQPSDHRAPSGDRRQLTVMFCDLVGSTALSEKLDPEELHMLVRAYQETCGAVISRYDGHIAQYLGDGLLVYFGYPAAHEDDARRAVQTGLEILAQLQVQSFSQPLSVRIGIHTGLVVVGEIGSGEKREQLALGETPNIAARVQGKAEPNTVVISADTHHLVQSMFAYQALGPQELKGLSTPLPLYRVLHQGTAQSRFAVAVQAGLTPLVGREEEVELLQRRWERVKAGEGLVILLSGEAGIGKSRLLQTLKEYISEDPHIRVEAQCSPFYQNSALYPVAAQLQRFLQFKHNDTPQEKLAKLERSLTPLGLATQEAVTLLAGLLSITLPEDLPPLQLSPQKQKEKTLEILVLWLQEEAACQPVWLVVEDLHWADPTTLELIGLLLGQVSVSRLFVVLTYRPEFSPPWPMRGHMFSLTLSRLLEQQTALMAQRVTGGKSLPPEVIQQLVAKTDGVPLFVEEMTKTVIESELLCERDGQYELTGPLSQFAIPSTLQDSLMARLDRLNSAREVAQLGATIGREFSYQLLQAASSLDETRLRQGLTQLVQAELVYQRGIPPEARYIFKHALLQDAAYQSLLKSIRQQYHQQIGQALVERFSDIAATRPELLAYHFTQAGLNVEAIPYWQKAGQQAVERSAFIEGISHLQNGLAVLEQLPESRDRDTLEFSLQAMLGVALMSSRGWAMPEVLKAYSRAQELAQHIGEMPHLFPVLWGIWAYYAVLGRHPTSIGLAKQCLQLAQRINDPVLLIGAHHTYDISFWQGELVQARYHMEQMCTLYDSQQHSAHAALYGIDLGIAGYHYLELTVWTLGYPELALKLQEDRRGIVGNLRHGHSIAWSFFGSSMLYYLLREPLLAQENAETAVTLSQEQGFHMTIVVGTTSRGWALAQQGHVDEGIAELQQAIRTWRNMGGELGLTWMIASLTDAYLRAGRSDDGLTAVAEALAICQRNDERWCEAELYRLKGELLLNGTGQTRLKNTMKSVAEAEECFHKAMDIAHKQQAKSWELRAAMSLARLWQRQDKSTEAQELLSEVYHWFTEGFDTKDLQEAKTLLGEIS